MEFDPNSWFMRLTSRLLIDLVYTCHNIYFPKHLNADTMTLLKNVAVSVEKSHWGA